MNKRLTKAVFGVFLFALICFDLSIITNNTSFSVEFVKKLYAQPVPCVEGSPDWPDCNSGGGPGGGTKGWIYVRPFWQFECYKIVTVNWALGQKSCWAHDGAESQIKKICVSSGAETPDPNCILNQLVVESVCQGTNRGALPNSVIPSCSSLGI